MCVHVKYSIVIRFVHQDKHPSHLSHTFLPISYHTHQIQLILIPLFPSITLEFIVFCYKLLKKFRNSSLINHVSFSITFCYHSSYHLKACLFFFKWIYQICNGFEIMESTLQLDLIQSQKWNLAKHCVLTIVQIRWRMKTMCDSLLGNTTESQY